MRADRLLRLVWILSGRRAPVPASWLAAELEVSTRTVLRDVEALSAAGVPVYTEQGRHGGVRLLPWWRPDMLGLDPDEARALAAVVSLPGARLLGLEEPVLGALAKVGESVAGGRLAGAGAGTRQSGYEAANSRTGGGSRTGTGERASATGGGDAVSGGRAAAARARTSADRGGASPVRAGTSADRDGASLAGAGGLRLGSRILIDPEGWLPGAVRPPWVTEILTAVEDGLAVRFRYTAGVSGRVSEVTVPALGLLVAGSEWYLVGRLAAPGTPGGEGSAACPAALPAGSPQPGRGPGGAAPKGGEAPGWRTRFFRLDRIDALVLGEAVPEGSTENATASPEVPFDLEAEWREARQRFRERFRPLPAVLEVEASAVGRLRSLVRIEEVAGGAYEVEVAGALARGQAEKTRQAETPAQGPASDPGRAGAGGDEATGAPVAAARVQGEEPARPSWLTVHVTFADVSHALEVLPRLAGQVRVVSPPRLQTALRELAHQLLAGCGDEPFPSSTMTKGVMYRMGAF